MMRLLRLLIMMAIVISPSLGFEAQAQDSSVSSEYLIKAGFIYNFANLVEWPSNAFAQPDSPIVIGILGTDPFGTIIDKIVQDKKIGTRGFVVKRLKWGADLKELRECKILFIGASERAHMDELVQMLRGLPVLTVGETPGFAERGGVIRFVLEDNRV